jgi:hypothetical protein
MFNGAIKIWEKVQNFEAIPSHLHVNYYSGWITYHRNKNREL